MAENEMLRLKKLEQQIHSVFLWGAYFCIGAYKHNVVVVIKSVAYNNYNIRP